MSFTFIASAGDWARIAPLLVLAGMGLIMLLADLALPQGDAARESIAESPGAALPFSFLVLPLLGLLSLVGAFVATIVLFVAGDQLPAFNEMVASDQGTLYAYMIILSAAILGVLLSPGYLKRLRLIHQGEYYGLLIFATVGMMLMAAARSFLTVFLGLEILSLALYILCGYVTRRPGSQESGMKYFLLSSFASAFLLYGIALIYGATGNTSFVGILNFLKTHSSASTLLLIGMGLLVVGFSFKVSAVPFQAWTPDVYDGAPAPVTAFMSVGTKAAALIAFARVFTIVLQPISSAWVPVVWAIAILTIVGGNILALVQSNVKRLLAYSSIAHAGYLLIGVVAGGVVGLSAILFYLFCYTFLNMGAFGVVSVLERTDNTGSSLSDIGGLWYRQPVLAGLLAFFMLALAGFPPMAGFAGKYYLFYAALVSGHPELLIIGVLASVLGMYYYLRVIASMFMEQEMAVPAAAVTFGPLSVPTSSLPASNSGRRVSTKLTAPSTASATAVAVKASPVSKATAVAEKAEPEKVLISWPTWLALALAVLGTLAMGTVLPFWLVQLAQQAAHMM